MVAEVLAFAPLRSRLAERILDLAEKHGQVVEGGTCIAHSLSQNDLALLSFGSRPRVNRILKEWADRGILVSDSKRYLVKDFDALRQESTQHYS
jgi:CRP-like cAMP-binding protein